MKDIEIQNCKKQLYKLYARFGLRSLMYTHARIFTAPLFEIEKYVPKSGKIFDIGCGSGIFANLLLLMSKDRSVIGSDVSTKRINLAQNTVTNKNNLSFCVQNCIDFNLDNISIVTIIDLLHHISFQEQESLLEKIYSGLEIPGLLILKDLEKKPLWKYIFHYVQDSISYRSKLFFRSSQNMKELLNDVGFRVNIIPLESLLPYPHILYLCRKI